MGTVLDRRRLRPPDPDDAELMVRVANPVTASLAMAELYRRYERPLLAYARRRLDDRMRAEELVQETMTRLWKMAPRYDASKGTVECVVFTIASRALIDVLRRQQRSLPLAFGDDSPEISIDDPTTARDQCLAVRGALECLSSDHRAVIELAYFGGFSQTQIAERLRIPLGTVKTRTYWALRALHEVLSAHDD